MPRTVKLDLDDWEIYTEAIAAHREYYAAHKAVIDGYAETGKRLYTIGQRLQRKYNLRMNDKLVPDTGDPKPAGAILDLFKG